MKTQIIAITFIFLFCFAAQPVMPFFTGDDPNESGIADNRDLKSTTAKYNKASSDLAIDVIFWTDPNMGTAYGTPSLRIYISTDGNNTPEYQVQGWSTGFIVQRGQGGYFGGTPVHSGTATLSRSKYSLKIPVKALGLTDDSNPSTKLVYYWCVGWQAGPGTVGDRMPDSGSHGVKVQL